MNGKIETETRTYALCPSCPGRLGTIDHLVGEFRHVGPWHCDSCGEGWAFDSDGREVRDLEKAHGKYVDVTVTLTLQPQKLPIEFTLHTKQHEPIDDGAEYFYNEHTCPTNWMRNVVKVGIGDSTDPHGLFEFSDIVPGHVKAPEE